MKSKAKNVKNRRICHCSGRIWTIIAKISFPLEFKLFNKLLQKYGILTFALCEATRRTHCRDTVKRVCLVLQVAALRLSCTFFCIFAYRQNTLRSTKWNENNTEKVFIIRSALLPTSQNTSQNNLLPSSSRRVVVFIHFRWIELSMQKSQDGKTFWIVIFGWVSFLAPTSQALLLNTFHSIYGLNVHPNASHILVWCFS